MYLCKNNNTDMEVIKTDIEGVVIIEPRIFKDARGYFFESFHSESLTKGRPHRVLSGQ